MINRPKSSSQAIALPQGHVADWVEQGAIVFAASMLVAVCARFGSLPLPFTPVPLTLQNFAVVLVGLTLGSRRGAAALALYLAEGAMGFPVFSPIGPGGIAQLLGATGGFLMAYPAVAFLAGWIFERSRKTFAAAALAAVAAELLLFTAGVSWLLVFTRSVGAALNFGLYPFFFAEVMKVMSAAGIASRRAFRRS